MQPLAQFPYLQWLSMVLNRITDLHGLVGPALECVNLNGWSLGFIPNGVIFFFYLLNDLSY